MRARAAAVALLAGLCGCGVPLDLGSSAAFNGCETSSDCFNGATCSDVGGQRQCVVSRADLAGLRIEVIPGGGARSAGSDGVSYLLDPSVAIAGLRDAGSARYDVELPRPATLATVIYRNADDSADPQSQCVAADDSIPARVLFRRVAPYGGMPAAELSVDSAPIEPFALVASVPPGHYDIYVTPSETCASAPRDPAAVVFPPYFIAGQELAGDATLQITLPRRERLSGTLTVPEKLSIAGWTLALVEPDTGLEISTVQQVPAGASNTVDIDIDFYLPFGSQRLPIMRLRAPEPTFSPVVHWPLEAADLNGDFAVALELGVLDGQPVRIKASVVDDVTNDPVASTVTIRSDDAVETGVVYQVTVDTMGGALTVDLLPGSYSAFAQPKLDSNAVGSARWIITQSSAKTPYGIQLPRKVGLQATVATPEGDAIETADASAVAPVTSKRSYFQSVIGGGADNSDPDEPEIEPRSVYATVAGGVLSMAVDPGIYDLCVQPPDGTRFPWLIRPRIDASAPDATGSLGTLTVPYPAALFGELRDSTGVLAGATLRAWLPVSDPGGERALQVAQTTTAADGTYVIVVSPAIEP